MSISGQSPGYQVPDRVSLPVMVSTLDTFLAGSSGGCRTLPVAIAMMSVLGEGLSLFERIESHGLNKPDAAAGALGDIMCYDQDGYMVLAVEVGDRELTLSDVRSSIERARKTEATITLLFMNPGVRKQDREAIQSSLAAAWASGLNVHQADIIRLAISTFVLLVETWRPLLFSRIGEELDRRGDHADRRDWHCLLSALGEKKP